MLNQKKSEADLLIFCSARNGGISYASGIDSFPNKLEKAFPENDTIIIYPSQSIVENMFGNYEDIDVSAITKGVEAIQKIGKEVGSIFKKGNQS